MLASMRSFYADRDGHGRIVAICTWPSRVRTGGDVGLWSRSSWQGPYSNSLWIRTANRRRQKRGRSWSQGLVLVLLPGDFLSLRPYRQFHDAIRPGNDLDIKNRLAIVNDLDYCGSFRWIQMHVSVDCWNCAAEVSQRLPADLPGLQCCDANDVLRARRGMAELDNRQVTVLFSGRKMGKSSLLRHQFQRCQESTDRLARSG